MNDGMETLYSAQAGSLTFVEHLRADRLALPADPVLVLGRHAEVVRRARPQVLHDEGERVPRGRHLAPLHLARVAVVWKIEIGSFIFSTTTGLFTASGHFDIPLISVVDGPILKLFGVVIVITGWFGLVYNNA